MILVSPHLSSWEPQRENILWSMAFGVGIDGGSSESSPVKNPSVGGDA